MRTPSIALWVLCSFLAAAVHADESFRCGKWVVNRELSVAELRRKCGAPTSLESRSEDLRNRNPNTGMSAKVGKITVETWTYDRGNRGAPMVVIIVDGKIKSIDRKQ